MGSLPVVAEEKKPAPEAADVRAEYELEHGPDRHDHREHGNDEGAVQGDEGGFGRTEPDVQAGGHERVHEPVG